MKKLIFILVVLVMMFSLVSYGAEQAEFVLKASIDQYRGSPGHVSFEKFKELVEERSNGRIKVDVYPDGVLGGERDVIEGLQLGTIEMSMPSNAPLTAFVPSLNLFELPFLFANDEHFNAVMNSEVALGFDKDLSEAGIHLLGFGYIGLRNIMTTEKAINSIEDLKGLKIRLMENPAHLDAFEAWGASPLPMAYGELYTALETGAIDGAEAANSNYWGKKFYEVAPNWAMVGWMRLVGPIIMSKIFYDKLPSDLQKIVDDAGIEIAQLMRELYVKSDDETLVLLKEWGIKITTPDRAPFVEASQVVYDKWADKVGGRERIDAILNFEY